MGAHYIILHSYVKSTDRDKIKMLIISTVPPLDGCVKEGRWGLIYLQKSEDIQESQTLEYGESNTNSYIKYKLSINYKMILNFFFVWSIFEA